LSNADKEQLVLFWLRSWLTNMNIQNFTFSQPINNAPNNNYTSQDPSSSMEVDEFAHRGHSSNIDHN